MHHSESYKATSVKAKSFDFSNSKKIVVNILGNHSTQFFTKSIKNQLILAGFNPEINESEYDQIDLTILDQNSKLYSNQPDIIIIFESSLKLKDEFYSLNEIDRLKFHAMKINSINNRITSIRNNKCQSKIIHYSYEFFDDMLFGNYFANVENCFYQQIFHLNSKLLKLTKIHDGFFIFEINRFLKRINNYRDWKSLTMYDLHFQPDAINKIAYENVLFIKALHGIFNKCLILDLDNTLWGGVIGDDGISNIQIGSLGNGKAFTNIQKWALELKKRGIIIAICSKNNETIAKEPFEKHPEMILKIKDISVFVANWKNKADNIRYIQEILNIGFDSMVFIDDNPAEREIVRQNLPAITIPELPEDPSDYYPFLTSLNLFETASYSKNDKDRTLQYQQEAKRKNLSAYHTDINSFLKSLNMIGIIEDFNTDDISRISQLTQRSNQFNLRTIRYNEDDIIRIINSDNFITYSVKLKDKFGDHGLISLVILEKKSETKYFIDTWIMSCRVLNRGVDSFIFNEIINDLKNKKINTLCGEYIATKKNKLVSKLLDKIGMKNNNKHYTLNINKANTINNFIKYDKLSN